MYASVILAIIALILGVGAVLIAAKFVLGLLYLTWLGIKRIVCKNPK